MFPWYIPSASSISTGLLLSMQGLPSRARARQLSIGSSNHWLTLSRYFFSASRRISSLSRTNKLHGASNPKSVIVKALFTQLRRENAVVGQRVTIDFARHFLRQP